MAFEVDIQGVGNKGISTMSHVQRNGCGMSEYVAV